jgi:hypothetical protein
MRSVNAKNVEMLAATFAIISTGVGRALAATHVGFWISPASRYWAGT